MKKERNLVKRAILIFTVLFTVLFTISFFHLHNANELSGGILLILIVVFVVGLLITISTVIYLSNEYKNDLMGFTPHEIGMLYSEYKSLIEQLSESVISIDKDFKIITLNEQFKNSWKYNNTKRKLRWY